MYVDYLVVDSVGWSICAESSSCKCFFFVVGISSTFCLVFDLRPSLLCSLLMISSCRHFGVCLLSDFNISKSILESILCCICNQCSSLRHSVVLSLDVLFKMIFAPMFCIHCIVFIDLLAGMQVWNCSSLDEIELMIWLMCDMLLSMYFLMFLICIRFTIAALHLLVMWASNWSKLSRISARYLTWSHWVIVSLMTIL